MGRHGQNGSRKRDKEGVRWGGGETRTSRMWGGEEVREDKEMERKVLTSTDFTVASAGRGRSVYIKGTPLPGFNVTVTHLIFPTH